MIYLLRVIETIGCKITKNSCKPFINGITFRVSWAKVSGRGSADGQKQEMYAGEVLADGQIQEMIAGEVLADDIPRCLSQENSSPPIIRAVYRRKGVRPTR